MIPRDKLLLRHGVVLDPDYSRKLIRSRQLKDVRIYADRVVVGKNEFPFTTTTKSMSNGMIYLGTTQKAVCFAARGFGQKLPNRLVTQTLWDLMTAAESRDEAIIGAILSRVKRSRRRLVGVGAVIVAFIVVFAVVQGLVTENVNFSSVGLTLVVGIALLAACAVVLDLLLKRFKRGASGVRGPASKDPAGTGS